MGPELSELLKDSALKSYLGLLIHRSSVDPDLMEDRSLNVLSEGMFGFGKHSAYIILQLTLVLSQT